MSLSVCVVFNSFCSLVLLCSLVELWNQPCVNLILRYNLDNLFIVLHFWVLLGLLSVLSKLYLPLILESLVHAFLLNIYHMACFTFFDPIYRVNSIES